MANLALCYGYLDQYILISNKCSWNVYFKLDLWISYYLSFFFFPYLLWQHQELLHIPWHLPLSLKHQILVCTSVHWYAQILVVGEHLPLQLVHFLQRSLLKEDSETKLKFQIYAINSNVSSIWIFSLRVTCVIVQVQVKETGQSRVVCFSSWEESNWIMFFETKRVKPHKLQSQILTFKKIRHND